MAGNSGEASTADRALRWIGELDHPFYDDERQRHIWYEASTIGFQLFLFVNLALAAAMLWIGGRPALAYAIPLFVVQQFAGFPAVYYAKKRYAEYVPRKGEIFSGRNNLYFFLLLLFVGGIVRALFDAPTSPGSSAPDSFFGGFGEGLLFGLPVAVIVGFFVIAKKRKQADEEEALGEFDEL